MRKILRGLAVATAISLAPLSVAAISTAPAQAAESVVTGVGSDTPTRSAPVSPDLKALARRTITIRDLAGPNARLRIRVRPEFGNKTIVIQTRKSGTFRTTGRIRTNARGVAVKIFAGSRRGIRYRVIAVGGQKYSTAAVAFTITRRTV